MDKVLIIGFGAGKEQFTEIAAKIGVSVMELSEAVDKLSLKSDLASYSAERLNEIAKSINELDSKRFVSTEHRGKHRTHRNKWR